MLLPQDRPNKPCAGCPDRGKVQPHVVTPRMPKVIVASRHISNLPKQLSSVVIVPQTQDRETAPPPSPEQQTRNSCIECVEKHIGAAWVLASEYQNGYPYHTLIVGHLHEAEEESKQWPHLNSMIRDSRKEFQSMGRIPDFQLLSLKIKEIRDSS